MLKETNGVTEKINSEQMYNFIIDFVQLYGQTPGVGFLAGYYKTSKSLIYKKLNKLEKEGKVKKIAGAKYKTNYEIII